jgi:hypothetical protein
MSQQQYRALFVISSAVIMLALVLIPSVLVFLYG